MKILNFILLLFLYLLSACSLYDSSLQFLPGQEKTVYVKPFTNNTNQFGIEAPFTNAVIDEFLNDGRLNTANTPEESDGILTVCIKRYILKPLTYDVDGAVEQYKLWLVTEAALIDKETKETMWTENFEGIQIYVDSARRQIARNITGDAITEQEAQALIWDKLSRKIVRRTIKGFIETLKNETMLNNETSENLKVSDEVNSVDKTKENPN
jgi:hypothetical protein